MADSAFPLAIFVPDSTPNTLAGYNGSGNFSTVTLAGNISLSAGVLTVRPSQGSFGIIG